MALHRRRQCDGGKHSVNICRIRDAVAIHVSCCRAFACGAYAVEHEHRIIETQERIVRDISQRPDDAGTRALRDRPLNDLGERRPGVHPPLGQDIRCRIDEGARHSDVGDSIAVDIAYAHNPCREHLSSITERSLHHLSAEATEKVHRTAPARRPAARGERRGHDDLGETITVEVFNDYHVVPEKLVGVRGDKGFFHFAIHRPSERHVGDNLLTCCRVPRRHCRHQLNDAVTIQVGERHSLGPWLPPPPLPHLLT